MQRPTMSLSTLVLLATIHTTASQVMNAHVRKGSSGVMLLTSFPQAPCRAPHGSHVLRQAMHNHQQYAALHGYSLQATHELTDPQLTGSWNKEASLHAAMTEPANANVRWFVWVDSDCLFVNVTAPLEPLLQRFDDEGRELVLWGNETKVRDKLDPEGFNAGVMLVKNTADMRAFMRTLKEYGRGWNKGTSPMGQEIRRSIHGMGDPGFIFNDQAGIVYLLKTQPGYWPKVLISEDVGGWRPGGFHTHFKADVPLPTLTEWPQPSTWRKDVPMLVHYAGCSFCFQEDERRAWYSVRHCLTHWLHAYDFAAAAYANASGGAAPPHSALDVGAELWRMAAVDPWLAAEIAPEERAAAASLVAGAAAAEDAGAGAAAAVGEEPVQQQQEEGPVALVDEEAAAAAAAGSDAAGTQGVSQEAGGGSGSGSGGSSGGAGGGSVSGTLKLRLKLRPDDIFQKKVKLSLSDALEMAGRGADSSASSSSTENGGSSISRQGSRSSSSSSGSGSGSGGDYRLNAAKARKRRRLRQPLSRAAH